MLHTLNEEDQEENCLKFFFSLLHGVFVENKKSYLDIFTNKAKYMYIYDEETFCQEHGLMSQHVESMHQSIIQPLMKYCIEYMLNRRVTVSNCFSKVLMLIILKYPSDYQSLLMAHFDFYGPSQRTRLCQLLTCFS